MSADLTNSNWSNAGKTSFRVVAVFVLLFVCSFSFPHNYLPDIGSYTHVFFEKLVQWFGSNILHIKHPYTVELISDSTGMYINVLVLLLLAILISLLWALVYKRTNYPKCYYWFLVCIRYYLAMQLLVYGLDKVFKQQFYLPEPNTLFTTLGNTYKDLLYWSTMGVSRTYSIFTGLLEIVAALLLFFRRTQLLAACIATAIMFNVLLLNISFDISVKLYAMFLLLLCLLLLVPYVKNLYAFFLLHKPVQYRPTTQNPLYKRVWQYRLIKLLVIACILFDCLSGYIASKNFNDDQQPRPYLHGAYNVETFISNGDTVPPLTTDQLRWHRMFIHRKGYLITQMMNDEMKDYELQLDSAKQELTIMNTADSSIHFFTYINFADTALQLNGKLYEDSLNIYLKKIDLLKLPLLEHGFHWTIDN
jgi:uncharacterized membrane protein YphA (DoxX/SURF4 family)